MPRFSEGEIWWCSLGENVGTEIGGKGEYFKRPVIVLAKIDYRSFIGTPMTSKPKEGSWYVSLKINGFKGTATLIQSRYLDSKRLDKRIATLSEGVLDEIRNAYIGVIRHERKSPAYKRADAGNPETC